MEHALTFITLIIEKGGVSTGILLIIVFLLARFLKNYLEKITEIIKENTQQITKNNVFLENIYRKKK